MEALREEAGSLAAGSFYLNETSHPILLYV